MQQQPEVGSALPAAWEERAVARSLTGARARSAEQARRLLTAARSLARAHGDAAFTITQVVGHARSSLKTFYRHFDGRDDLLLALFEEESHRGAALIRARMEGVDSPLERVSIFVRGLFSLVGISPACARLLVRENLRLSDRHPAEVGHALSPLLDLLVAEIEMAMAAGAIRAGNAERDAAVVFNLVLAHIQAMTLDQLGEDQNAAETHLWEFCRAALEQR